jgi:hypothetical protein
VFGFSANGSATDGNTQLSLNGGAFVLNSTNRGWYNNSGSNTTTNKNYIAGTVAPGVTANNFFLFDLTSVGVPITSATLQLVNPATGYSSTNPTQTYTVYDVSTSFASISAGTGGVAAFNDFGSGGLYAIKSVSAADNGTTVAVGLNGSAVADLEAARTGSGQWGAGGTLSASAAPEPGTFALLALGGLALVKRRRK